MTCVVEIAGFVDVNVDVDVGINVNVNGTRLLAVRENGSSWVVWVSSHNKQLQHQCSPHLSSKVRRCLTTGIKHHRVHE